VAPFLKRPLTAIVTDENVAAAHLATLERALAAKGIRSTAIVMPPGEKTKSYQHLAELCDKLLGAGIERRDRIIAFGGGVIGDLAGFAAAILRRGVDFIQIPTTLLSQVDSSVGGKTGINSAHGKNLIGAFHQPLAVITDIALLDTLPKRELAAGYAEVAKYGLLGDAGFFDWLEGSAPAIMRGDSQARIHSIRKSCEAKAQIVAEDEHETGVRALLNLGHTFGHALESATGYSQRLLHGEGVSIGMVQAFRFSERQHLCAPGTAERVAKHLKSVGLPIHASQIPGELPPPATLLEIMRQDKKAQGGRLTFILARGIGEAFIARDVPEHDVLDFLTEDLRQR
jgi:3-dehydroquinate synthase